MKYRGRKSLRILCAVLAGSLFLAACSKTETTEKKKKKEGKSEAETQLALAKNLLIAMLSFGGQ